MKKTASDSSSPQDDKPLYAGHRQRLRARFLEHGADSLPDYELLEMLLFSAIPRRDVKPIAKKLLARFGDLWGVLQAKPEQLAQEKLSESIIGTLLVTGAVVLRAQKSSLIGRPLLNNWQRIVDYCRAAMGHEPKEQFRLLFLDRRNQLLGDEIQQRGTIDHAPVYPREIVQRALELGAGALILVHNHPSGDVTPSHADIQMTKAIIEACKPLGITVHDHLIVGRDRVESFKTLGIL